MSETQASAQKAQDTASNATSQASGTSSTPPAAQTVSNAPKEPKGKKPQPQGASAGSAPAAEGEQKLSGKELKLKQKAEKQARRAQEKAAKDTGGPSTAQNGAPPGPKPAKGKPGAPSQPNPPTTAAQRLAQPQHRRTGSQSQAQRPLPIRRRNSQGTPKERKPVKEVSLFNHLYSNPRRSALDSVSKEVHPAVLALGHQMSSYTITGSSARCVAMLLAFKAAIASYTTPPTTSLARHLTSHYLSPQIEYLKSHRPISVSMGNAIRWLKDYIIQIDPDVPEHEAKADIADAIDTFIRERITVADTAIATTAAQKIHEGARVVTFGKSSIVERTLLQAHGQGKKFSVAVLDSRPLFEGRNLVRALSKAGVKVTYALLPAASHVLRDASVVLLGAHAMMANGRLYSRVGTAGVAMLAHGRDVPVIVCCESVKFTDRVALDSIVLNEVAPSEELVLEAEKQEVVEKVEEKAKAGKGEKEEKKTVDTGLQGWKDVQGLQLLNILYDVTPAEYVDMVITEYGSLPPSSVPVVHRISTERDVRA
ncbi:Initiation factor 2 subunit-like protein 2 [Elsinoe fawcettii]|nr:Initiation factor 2 subunit-like protein 2 [Elsinoe fawcettii]